MRLWMKFSFYLGGLLAVMTVTACVATTTAAENTPTLAPTLTSTPSTVAQQPTDIPTQQPTPQQPVNLVIWWPEPLVPLDNEDVNSLLSEQVSAFETANGVQVERRLKKVQDAGGIMSTLRTAGPVAPGALPDLTLLRREDMLAAAQAGLIQSLEGWVPTATLSEMTNFSNKILELGQVGGTLYGVPYMLEILHLTYRPRAADEGPISWGFDDVLTRGIPYVFPAGRANPINATFFVQYLSAGGSFPQDGVFHVDEDALRTVLTFYEEARQNGVLDDSVISYVAPADYAFGLVDGTFDMAVVNSTIYLNLLEQDPSLRLAPVPTASGTPTTVLNGWMWVMTTTNPLRQSLAINFLDWMIDADRQNLYAQSINMLPSQRTAFRNWSSEQLNITQINQMLNNAYMPLSSNEGGTAARILQNALIAVLSGERTAEDAAQDVIKQLGQ